MLVPLFTPEMVDERDEFLQTLKHISTLHQVVPKIPATLPSI
jgi:hypothetical protein